MRRRIWRSRGEEEEEEVRSHFGSSNTSLEVAPGPGGPRASTSRAQKPPGSSRGFSHHFLLLRLQNPPAQLCTLAISWGHGLVAIARALYRCWCGQPWSAPKARQKNKSQPRPKPQPRERDRQRPGESRRAAARASKPAATEAMIHKIFNEELEKRKSDAVERPKYEPPPSTAKTATAKGPQGAWDAPCAASPGTALSRGARGGPEAATAARSSSSIRSPTSPIGGRRTPGTAGAHAAACSVRSGTQSAPCAVRLSLALGPRLRPSPRATTTQMPGLRSPSRPCRQGGAAAARARLRLR